MSFYKYAQNSWYPKTWTHSHISTILKIMLTWYNHKGHHHHLIQQFLRSLVTDDTSYQDQQKALKLTLNLFKTCVDITCIGIPLHITLLRKMWISTGNSPEYDLNIIKLFEWLGLPSTDNVMFDSKKVNTDLCFFLWLGLPSNDNLMFDSKKENTDLCFFL